MSWRMGLTGLCTVLQMHSSYRLGVSELQDDKLSVPKPKKYHVKRIVSGPLRVAVLAIPRLPNMLHKQVKRRSLASKES